MLACNYLPSIMGTDLSGDADGALLVRRVTKRPLGLLSFSALGDLAEDFETLEDAGEVPRTFSVERKYRS